MTTIKQLRQQGLLDEALEAAQAALDQNPISLSALNDMAWVHDAFCKKSAEEANVELFSQHFHKIFELEMPHNDMLHNTLCWRIRALLANASAKVQPNQVASIADQCFGMLQMLSPERPGDHYSAIGHAFQRVATNWLNFPKFMEWWGWGNFRPQDYECETLPNGRRMSVCLAEQCYNACAKIAINSKDKETQRNFAELLGKATEEHPNFTYTGYYTGKLLLALGEDEKSLDALMPFVRKKKTEFWAWQLLSEAYEPDDERHLACLLRAASCKTRDEFLVKVRFALAKILIRRGDYTQAKDHLRKYLNVKEKDGTRVAYEVDQWSHEPWFSNVVTDAHAPIDFMEVTNSILLSDTPETYGVVAFHNKEKHIATVITGAKESIFFSTKGLAKDDSLKTGTSVMLRIAQRKEGSEFVSIASLRTSQHQWRDFHKQFKGTIVTNKTNTALFARSSRGLQAYIHPKMATQLNLKEGDACLTTMLLNYDKRNERWSWIATAIELTTTTESKE